jgi:L-asparaginase II
VAELDAAANVAAADRNRLRELEADLEAARVSAASMDRENTSLAEQLATECDSHNATIEHADRLRRMLEEPEFLKAEVQKKGLEMQADVTAKHWASKLMVMSFADTIGDSPNLIELSLGDDEFGYFIVTIQRRHGKSAMQLLGEAKSTRQQLRTRIDDLEAALHDLNESAIGVNRFLRGESGNLSNVMLRVFNTCISQASYRLAPPELPKQESA